MGMGVSREEGQGCCRCSRVVWRKQGVGSLSALMAVGEAGDGSRLARGLLLLCQMW